MIGWNTGGSSPLYNFLTIPGGGALAGSFTSGGTTTTWVPLIDASSSTLGLVNAASPQSGMATTYTYDPSGTPTANGTANEWPFQYQGMEKEFTDPGPYYYSGSGQFYSPQFVRSLSEAGQTGSGGAGGPPPTQVAYGPGSEGNGSFGHWYVNNVLDPSSTGNQLGNLPDIGFGFSSETTGYVIPLGAIARDIEEWVSFFEWLLGGSGAPRTPRKLLRGRHPLYYKTIATQVVDETSAAQGSADPMTLTGDASYYRPNTEDPGKSACRNEGYPYTDPNGLTAAVKGVKRKFPCGTTASVSYGPKTITVKVIDAGPYEKGRVIDLSPGAFKALAGSLDAGLLHSVTVQIPAGPKPPLE